MTPSLTSAIGREGKDKVKRFVADYGIQYPTLLLGGDMTVVKEYGGLRSIPVTFVIDREGKIREKFVGYHSKKRFESTITPLL